MSQVYLARWEWDPLLLRWRSPGGTAVGLLDLRTLAQQATAAGTGGPGIFVYASPQVIANSIDLGAVLARVLASNERSSLRTRLGLTDPIPAGVSVLDFLWNLFTLWSDPTGQTAPKPLIPGIERKLELHLGGFSPIRVEKFDIDTHPHAPKVIATLQQDYRAQRRLDQTLGRDTYRRLLDVWRLKYKTDPARFVPSDLPAETPLPHATTLTDAFTRADSTNLNAADTSKTLDGAAGTWSWTETTGDLQIVSNAIRATATTNQNNKARAEQDLSSADQQVSILTTFVNGVGVNKYAHPAARFHVSDETHYTFFRLQFADVPSAANRTGLVKTVVGVSTDLDAQPQLDVPGTSETVLVKIDGSTLSGTIDGVVRGGPLTDTAIAGNLRTGMVLNPAGASVAGVIMDDFSAADLVATRRFLLVR